MTNFTSILNRASELVRNYPGTASVVTGMVVGICIEINRQNPNVYLIPLYGFIAFKAVKIPQVTMEAVRGLNHHAIQQAIYQANHQIPAPAPVVHPPYRLTRSCPAA